MARPAQWGTGRRALAGVAAAATGMSGVALLAPATTNASSHREAPYIADDPRADNTDVYTFVSPDDPNSVTMVANWWPFEEPNGGPNFYRFDDGAHYDVNIDNNGDAVADIVYRWTFSSSYRNQDTILYNTGVVTSLDDPDLNFRQTYDLQVIRGSAAPVTIVDNAPVAPSNVGPASMPDYAALREQAVVPTAAGSAGAGKSFTGQADDSFFADLRVFDLLYGGDLSEVGNDTLNGYNVQTIALQVPKAELALNGNAGRNPVIGVWSTTSRQKTQVLSPEGGSTSSGEFVQVSRLGNPLVNEVVIPIQDKDEFNASRPAGDARFLEYVTEPLVPPLIEAIYGIPAPATPRNDLVEVFLTGICNEAPCPGTIGEVELNSLLLNQDVSTIAPAEMLRLNMSVPPTARPNRLGVLAGDNAGFPNGRRLMDDVVDIELQVLEGELLGSPNDLGDAVDSNDLPFGSSFPYVALPHNSAVNASQFSGFERVAGADRFATAAAVARETFTSADTVLLASGLERHLPDALAGNYLAGFEKAPVLLTTNDDLPAVTQTAIDALGAKRIIVLGGTNAISAAQVDRLEQRYQVERIGGVNRYETAALIATRPPASYVAGKTAVVARGDVLADALVAGPIAYRAQYPVLLTAPTGLDAYAQAALQQLAIERVVVAGGTAAVSEGVVGAIRDVRGNDSMATTRLAGTDRQGTAVAFARFAIGELGFSRLHVDLARGDVTADALAGGPHAGSVHGVILLTRGANQLGSVTRDYLVQESITLERGHVLGGTAAVSAQVVAEAADAANSNDPLANTPPRS
jgi:hypothetical protein